MNRLRECSLFFYIRLKLILRDKITIGLFGAAVIIFLFMGGSLFQSAEDKSRIPIGIVDLDCSAMSVNLVERVKQNATLNVLEGTKQELDKELKHQRIEGIFIIKDGYEKRIVLGDTLELVSFFYLDGNTAGLLLPDILAGEMMFDICLSKGMNMYYNLSDGTMVKEDMYSESKYINYIEGLAGAPEFKFTFEIETIANEIPDNSILYIQIAFGILGMLVAFMILFMTSNIMVDKENGITSRLNTTVLSNISKNAGDILAVTVVNLFLNIGLCVIIYLTVKPLSLKNIACIYLVLFLYALEYSLLFCLTSRFFKQMAGFQTAGSFLVIICGLVGFLPMLDGILSVKVLKFFEFIPNSWFIKWITDIIA